MSISSVCTELMDLVSIMQSTHASWYLITYTYFNVFDWKRLLQSAPAESCQIRPKRCNHMNTYATASTSVAHMH